MKTGTWLRNKTDGSFALFHNEADGHIEFFLAGGVHWLYMEKAAFDKTWTRFRPSSNTLSVYPIWLRPDIEIESRNPCNSDRRWVRKIQGDWIQINSIHDDVFYIVSLEQFLRAWRPVKVPTRFERVG